jgi:hypothetical protein
MTPQIRWPVIAFLGCFLAMEIKVEKHTLARNSRPHTEGHGRVVLFVEFFQWFRVRKEACLRECSFR